MKRFEVRPETLAASVSLTFQACCIFVFSIVQYAALAEAAFSFLDLLNKVAVVLFCVLRFKHLAHLNDSLPFQNLRA